MSVLDNIEKLLRLTYGPRASGRSHDNLASAIGKAQASTTPVIVLASNEQQSGQLGLMARTICPNGMPRNFKIVTVLETQALRPIVANTVYMPDHLTYFDMLESAKQEIMRLQGENKELRRKLSNGELP